MAARVFRGRTRRRVGRGLGLTDRSASRLVAPNGALHSNDFVAVGERLEDRTLLATFAEAGSMLNFDLNVANQSVSVVSA